MPAKKTVSKKKRDIEEILERLEEIAELLESTETPLGESLELYKEGLELSVSCAGILEGAKQEIAVLHKTAEGLFEERGT